MIRYLTVFIMAVVMLGSVPIPAAAESAPIYTSWRNNVAVGGYDVVSFYSGKPLNGRKDYVTRYKGAQWRFSSRANLDLFKNNPDAFLPQYGGYCAWALANNKLAKGSPEFWHVRDGKLYLNFNQRIQNLWDADRESLIQQADTHWPQILNE